VRRRTAIGLALAIELLGLVLAGTAAPGLQVNTDHGKDLDLCRARYKSKSSTHPFLGHHRHTKLI
jgi:hypothetical protein